MHRRGTDDSDWRRREAELAQQAATVHASGQLRCSQARRKAHVRGIPKAIERDSLRRSRRLRSDSEYIPMSDKVDSSEGTRSDGDSLATGMMHLAIACTNVQR